MSLFGSFSRSIADLQRRVDECKLCAYGNMKANSGVQRPKSVGCTSGGLMVIGQCPGKTEVSTGYVYSGASGAMLKGILCSALGMSESQMKAAVRLTNVLRCMPPEGKTIVQKYARVCSQWLDDEVMLIKPQAILCLGALAGDIVMPGADMDTEAPTVYNVPGIRTHHPAYLMRVKSNNKDMYDKMYSQLCRSIQAICKHISLR